MSLKVIRHTKFFGFAQGIQSVFPATNEQICGASNPVIPSGMCFGKKDFFRI
jgi:hypothetical protein